MNTKEERYRALVEDARNDYISRPIVCNAKGVYLTWVEDCREINLWTYWQGIGNYDAKIMLVGQDWGFSDDESKVMRNIREINSGLRADYDYDFDKPSPTDDNLCKLFSVLGYDITRRCKDLFFTNFVLGYRSKGCSGSLNHKWITADAPYFARLVNIIEPAVMICLGKATFDGVQLACTRETRRIRSYNNFIESEYNPVAIPLQSGKTSAAFAVAHCGKIGTMNRNRTGNHKSSQGLARQIEDWKRIRAYIEKQT